MALVNCPECGHNVADSAIACPNCGRPLQTRPVMDKKVIVTDTPRREGMPKWAFIPLGLLGAVLLVIFFVMMSRNDDDAANSRVKVDVEAQRGTSGNSRDLSRTESQSVNIPSSADGSTVTVPDSSQSLTVPGSQTSVNDSPSKGVVVIDAKIAARTGSPQPVKNEKFYLLDKDLEMILSEADLEPIEGNTLLNSFGLSVLYPERYGDFNRAALRAIKDHIKYAGTTDSAGKAQLGGVDPNSYYLFGVTKTARGFAVWSSPVSIIAGENVLNLSPARLQEIDNNSE